MADLELYEFETEAFTPGETRAIFDFEAAVHGSGLRDCFDTFDVEHARWHETEFGQDATRDMLREHARMLNTWYLALDSLLGDILTCTSEVTKYSTAAARYVRSAADDYHRTRQRFEHVTTEWSLALLTGGADADYPPPTRTVNLPMQSLSDE
ncbi:hypothetical protein QFZ63_001483 [Streptomyces sp. B3I7]|uniref:hypothetical protein n=1 Tax=Streptomyces sp. B3I7 TaxID=3042269 RepID=UPI00278A2BFB|nr:hypothetical protein [Streptomyces sp. B3I7]MDQ0809769.1 hypothetical protein [Streptomyces sp. B3I7]